MLLLFNIVLFGFFQEATTQAVSSIVSQESVVRKTQFPRLVIPLAVVLTSLFNLGVNLVVVFVFMLASGIDADVDLAAVPARRSRCCSCSPTAVAMILSALFPRFRDTAIIWSVAVDGAVLRHAGALPARDRVRRRCGQLLALNPLAPLFELARKWVIDPDAPGPAAAAGGAALAARAGGHLRRSSACSRSWVFNREAPRIAEEL